MRIPRAEFIQDSSRIMKLAQEHGGVILVDECGEDCGAISIPKAESDLEAENGEAARQTRRRSGRRGGCSQDPRQAKYGSQASDPALGGAERGD